MYVRCFSLCVRLCVCMYVGLGDIPVMRLYRDNDLHDYCIASDCPVQVSVKQ